MSIHLSIAMDRQGVDGGFDITILLAHVNFTYPQGKLLSIPGQLHFVARGGVLGVLLTGAL